MSDKLVIGILGKINSGRSSTWAELIKRDLKTGWHKIKISPQKNQDVFVISCAPEQKKKPINEILKNDTPPIVLCSLLYSPRVMNTLDWFSNNGYSLYIQWLNPGFFEGKKYNDILKVEEFLQSINADYKIKNGHKSHSKRAEEIKLFLKKWLKEKETEQLVPTLEATF